MRGLTGSADVTLCEFLLTVESNSEVAEYCTLYLGNSPAVRKAAAGWAASQHAAGLTVAVKDMGSMSALIWPHECWPHTANLVRPSPPPPPPPPPGLPLRL